MDVLGYLLILLVFTLFLSLLYSLLRFLHKIWWTPIQIQQMMKSQGVKGPSYKFLHGNTKEIFNMRKDSMERPMKLSHNVFPRVLPHVSKWVNTYGSNFLHWYGPQAQLVVTEADLIKEVLSNRDGAYPKIDLEGYAKKLLGDGLSSSKGEKWEKMRKLANYTFHAESLASMVPAMITSTEVMLERWKQYNGKEMEVFEEFRVLTSEIISKAAFGSSYLEGKNIFELLMKLTLIISRNAYKIRLPVISQIFKSSDDKESEIIEHSIQDCIMEIINNRENLENEVGNRRGSDFLGQLLEANRDPEKKNWFSIEDIVDECKTFYFAGHETTTSLLSWTILLLSLHTDWQERARKEVFELFGNNNPNSDGIARLKIMNMIIQESLRLYPPVPFIKRKTGKKTKLGRLILPSEMELYISGLALHHDPKIWGEDVHLFKPERFEGGLVKATNNVSAAFLPFGFGPRTCVGLTFATAEAKIILAMILQRHVLTLSPTYVHSPVQIFMVRPQHGVQVVIHAI